MSSGSTIKVEEHVCCFGGEGRSASAATETITIAGPVGSSPSSDLTATAFSKATTLCANGGSEVDVLFVSEFGDPGPIQVYKNALTGTATISVAERVKGTKENFECSRRGRCDRDTGDCICSEGFASSDGDGTPRNDVDHWGIRGDWCVGARCSLAHGLAVAYRRRGGRKRRLCAFPHSSLHGRQHERAIPPRSGYHNPLIEEAFDYKAMNSVMKGSMYRGRTQPLSAGSSGQIDERTDVEVAAS